MKAEYCKIVFGLATYYNHSMTAEQISLHADDLMVLTPDQLKVAIKTYTADPENNFYPLPAKLLSVIKPVETDLDIGRTVAGNILTAISKFGSYRHDDARNFMGEVAWEVVKLQGGWKSICALDNEQLKQEQPRFRDMALTVLKRAKLGKLNEAPALPNYSDNMKKLIGSTFK